MYVYGKATGDDLDLDEQIIDKDFAREALGDWFKSFSNVRQMHSTNLPPAGKGVELTEDADGFWLKSRIVEPGAMKLAEEGVYSAYSVGISKPRIMRDKEAKGGRIVGGVISEVSLVDYPANPTCKAMVVKMAADGQLEETGAVLAEEPAAETETETETEKAAKPADDDKAKEGDAVDESMDDEEAKKILDDPSASADQVDTAAKQLQIEPAETETVEKTVPDAAGGNAVVEGTVEKASSDLSADARREAAKDGKAMPDGSYPTRDKAEFEKAVKAYGRAKDKDAVKSYLEKRAKDEGWEASLPDDWKTDGNGDEKKSLEPTFLARAIHDATCPACDLDVVKTATPMIEKNGLAMTLGPQARDLLWQMFLHECEEDGGTGAQIGDLYCLLGQISTLDSYVSSEAYQELFEQMNGDDGTLAFAALAELHKAPEPEIQKADGRPDAGTSTRVFYTNAAREQANAAMRAVHDSLASAYPDICLAGAHGDAAEESGDVHETGADAKVVVNEDADLVAVADPEQYVRASAIPELVKAALAATEDDRDEKFKAMLEARDGEIEGLKAEVEKLSAAPDPAKAPVRGAGRVLQDDTSEVERPVQGDDPETAMLKTLANGSDPGLRMYAQAELTKRAREPETAAA